MESCNQTLTQYKTNLTVEGIFSQLPEQVNVRVIARNTSVYIWSDGGGGGGGGGERGILTLTFGWRATNLKKWTFKYVDLADVSTVSQSSHHQLYGFLLILLERSLITNVGAFTL